MNRKEKQVSSTNEHLEYVISWGKLGRVSKFGGGVPRAVPPFPFHLEVMILHWI
jgi:hypothetical protein